MNLKKRASKSIAIALVGVALISPVLNTASAMEKDSEDSEVSSALEIENNFGQNDIKAEITKDDIHEVQSLMDTGVFKEFELDENDNLKLKKPLDTISKEYKLSNDQQQMIQTILELDGTKSNNPIRYGISAHWEGNAVKIKLSSSDVVALLSSAALLGPAAIKASLVGLGAAVGGPIGAAIAGFIGAISAKHLISFAGVVLAATSKNRGMYVKIGVGIFDYGVL